MFIIDTVVARSYDRQPKHLINQFKYAVILLIKPSLSFSNLLIKKRPFSFDPDPFVPTSTHHQPVKTMTMGSSY